MVHPSAALSPREVSEPLLSSCMPPTGPVHVVIVAAVVLGAAPVFGIELSDPATVRAFCALSTPEAPVASASHAPEGSGLPREVLPAVDGVLVHGDAAWADGVAARDRAHARARVLLQPHVVDVVSSGFAFEPWDDALGLLVVETGETLPLHGGAWQLGLASTDRIAFEVDEEDAEDLVAMRRMGSLSLRIVFELATAAEPDLSWCVDTPDGAVRIDAHLVSAELVEPLSGHVRARATTERFDAGRVRYGVEPCGTHDGAEPVADVARVIVSSDEGVAGEIAPIIELHLEARVSDCYVRQLATNARLQGAMTLGFRVDADGHSAEAEVLIDAVDSPDLTRCVLTAVDSLALPGRGAAVSDVQMTLTFDPDGQSNGR